MARYLPTLAELVSVDRLPAGLGFLDDAFGTVFSKLYCRDLYVNGSVLSGACNYELTLVSKTRLSLDILGGPDGVCLVLNPSFLPGGTSDFPMVLSYHWPASEFLDGRNFSALSFSFRWFYDFVVRFSRNSDSEILRSFVFGFFQNEDADAFQEFIDDFNLNNSPSTPLVRLSSENDADVSNDLINQLSSNGNSYNVLDVIFDGYIGTATDIEGLFDKLKRAFRSINGHFTFEQIKAF